MKLWSFRAAEGNIWSALSACGVSSWETEGADLLRLPMSGDWIMRERASRDERIEAVQAILRRRLNRPLHVRKRQVEREVVAARGRLQFDPGAPVEPTPEEWTTNCYVCDQCGRIIDQGTYEVVGFRADNTLSEAERAEIRAKG